MRTEWKKNFMCSVIPWGCWIYMYTILQSPEFTLATHEAFALKPQNLDDTVFINFPKNSNPSRAIGRHLYLPPEEATFVLPEVIENRVRSVFARPSQSPDILLKAPSPSEATTSLSYAANDQKILQSDVFSHINISMSCIHSEDEVYFRASISALKLRDTPIVQGSPGNGNCRIDRVGDEFKINFSGDLFWACGVRNCSTQLGKFYCLKLRFPAIPGILLKDDARVSMRCKAQERTTSRTRRFNVKAIDTSARMTARVATGGHKDSFETEIGLYRKTTGSDQLFDARIPSGGTVILGEEILLRAVVRDGDGWKYSKMSDVTINFIENKRQKKIMNSVWILDSNGCLNPEIREICSREQYKVSNLESYLIFEAFMFDNMSETDELIVNVKITGCLEGSDCILNCPASHVRKIRNVKTSQNNTIDWLNDISFRVVPPEKEYSRQPSKTHIIIPYILSALILVAIAALLCTIKIMKNQKFERILI
ncbi:uncharacterized protein LOC135172947 isoform X2 [Diachasmimorpha longicaudata]|uniref:uncharacterized protein LOC135172947 isoform X2 n=1 Tax=Diachasmimorpha longicaudata TaxID=58733 RepID=UPI0030B8DC50